MKRTLLILLTTSLLASCNQPPADVKLENTAEKADPVGKWVVVSTAKGSIDDTVKSMVVMNTVDGVVCRLDDVNYMNSDSISTKKKCIDL